ncbi:MAG TPA: replicative DNA helicase [Thermodesulfovibrionales bacterium]|jgi:replicative DNA helicase|nr:replicative DNA helicase [Thermodesulfovibrionales bacterium]
MRDGDLALDRLPPQNVEAEQSVLGAILLDNEAISKALEILSPDDFYREAHRRIFDAMIELYEKNEAIDLITVTDTLKRKNDLEAVGGVTYLSSVAGQVPTAANIRYHSKIIKEKALLRGLLSSTTEIAAKVYESSLEPDELVDFAERSIFNISDRRTKTSFYPLKEVIKSSFEMIEHLYDRKEAITGVPSGFTDLDELTTGFQPGDLIVIGGRPSMGKTALGLNIAQHVALEAREPVAIFSLEMSKEQLALRMLCAEAMVDSNSVRKGFIKKEDWHKLTSAAGRLAEAPIFIDDSSGTTVLEMRAKARRLKIEHHGGLGLVVVDYLQLMRSRGGFERREQEISEISRSLKGLAKELRVPVIALSQLNRGVEQRHDKRPTLADLRESGAIEQDADVIIFLYRDEVYNKENPTNKGKAEVIIAKQRNGPTDTVHLTFLSSCTRFAQYTATEYRSEDVF